LDKGGVEWLMSGTFRLFKSLVFQSIRIHELVDPDRLVVEYTSQCRSAHGDVPYDNRYLSIFEFADGQVIQWLEFTSPLRWQEAKAQIDAAKAASLEASP
jgi:ketosteroid isomerase-like protein